MMPKSLWSLLVLALVILDHTQGWRRRRRRRCPVTNCAVSAWTKYSPCSQPCGNGGTKKRTRTVTRAATCGGGCPYALTDIQPCNRGCPNGGTPVTWRCICKSGYSGRCCTGVNGGWSSWSSWNSCSNKCGSGVRVRTRTCTKPPPRYGGRPCTGSSRQSQACNTHRCPVNGGWSNWNRWSSCSQSCGTGSQERSRTCTRPPPSFGGKTCQGLTREKQVCNRQRCHVNGGWSGWSVWTTCTKTCGSGTQTRSRSCTQPPPQHGGKMCPGALKEQRVCNTHSCPVDGGWSSWFVSTKCSVTCGTGMTVFARTCTNPYPKYGGRPCQGPARKDQPCLTVPCPINGGWSNWALWTTCTKSCGSGTQTRSRSCTKPPPQHGGKKCPVAPKEQRVCNTKICPVTGGWSDWSGWGSCSKSCGTGFRKRFRSCTRPAPSFGGKSCPGKEQETHECNTHPCPVHGGWSVWSSWSSCYETCGGGIRERTRSCTNPPPFSGGKGCGTHYYESTECAMKTCPVDGGWSGWSVWSSCSKSCGIGSQERSRSCTQPSPSSGGKICTGKARDSNQCNSHPCPVHGGWSGWSSWSSCYETCGGGIRERTRSCTNPPPFSGGKGCGTHYYESTECAMKTCPVDGGWSGWSVWSSCSKSCGIGSQERSRSCTQPSPSSGGKICTGKARDSNQCNSHPCPVDGEWSAWSDWKECSVTCGTGVVSRERKCDNPAPAAGGRSCQGHPRDVKTCNTTKICIDPFGCYRSFPSSLLDDLRNEINWNLPPFSKQMDKVVKKCAHLARMKRIRFFAVENYGNCYGTQTFSPDNQMKTNQCNFGVGLEENFYVYEITG